MAATRLQPSGVIRAAMFFAFAQELRQIDVGQDSAAPVFTEAVRAAIDLYNVEPGRFCSEFAVTRATVSRWKSGEAVPGIYMRKQVIEWLANAIEAAAESDEANEKRRVIDQVLTAVQAEV